MIDIIRVMPIDTKHSKDAHGDSGGVEASKMVNVILDMRQGEWVLLKAYIDSMKSICSHKMINGDALWTKKETVSECLTRKKGEDGVKHGEHITAFKKGDFITNAEGEITHLVGFGDIKSPKPTWIQKAIQRFYTGK